MLDIVLRRCEHGTCFVPADQCQGDHILGWSNGGLTTLDNGRLGCGAHNRWWYATGQSHPPPSGPRPDANLDDDDLDPEPPAPPAPDEVGPRPPSRFMFRIALAPEPDIHFGGDGEQGCAIDLHPLGRTADRWRDYPLRLAA